MMSWTGPMKQAVVAVVSLSLIHTTVPPPTNLLRSPYHARAGQPLPFALSVPRNPKDIATKSATIEVMPELRGSSVKVVNGGKSNLVKHLTPPFDDKTPPIIRPALPDPLSKESGSRDATTLGPHGLRFIENKGQWDERARFQLRNGGNTLWLTNTGVVFDNVRVKAKVPSDPAREPKSPPVLSAHQVPDTYERNVFYEEFVNSQSVSEIQPIDIQPGAYNYLVGSDSAKWHTGAHAYAGIVYRNVWDGIDVNVALNGADIEQEFVVHPGADLSRVQVAYRGIDGLEVAKDGSLLVHTAYCDLKESAPRIYQEIAGNRVSVAGRFKLTSETSYTFKVESSHQEYALVIDPTLLYSTFLGGSVGYGCGPFSCATGESAQAIAVDAAGNAYVTGFTQSLDFPTTSGAFLTSGTFQSVAFVTKLNATGSQLVYSTFLGPATGGSGAYGYGIALDSAQEPYVTGITGQGAFPTTSNAYEPACPSGGNFFTKMNGMGNGLIYSTCFGLPNNTSAYAIAVGPSGKAYITGNAATGGLPTTPGAYQPTGGQPAGSGGVYDAFLTVFDPSASGSASLVYSTYLGGSNSDQGYAVAVDGFGMAYIAGTTTSLTFPVTPGAFQTTYRNASSGTSTAFVAKLNPSASGAASLLYSTYLGGSGKTVITGVGGLDVVNAIALDALGQAHVAGLAESVDFPVTSGAFQTSTISFQNAFVSTLNAAGNGLVQSTFLSGSSSGNYASAIALDSLGDAYVTGTTGAPDFPTTPNAFQPSLAGPLNAFVTELNPAGTVLVYSSYLGGSKEDHGYGIAVDPVGDAYVTGFTESVNFPITPFAFQLAINPGGAAGPADAFVTKFPLGTPVGLSITDVIPSIGGNIGAVTATIVGSGFHNGASLTLSCPGQTDIVATNVTASIDGRSLSGTFVLSGTNPGACNVVITNVDGTSISKAQGFYIEQGGSVAMWIDIVGPSRMRAGGSQNYYLVYGNNGSVNSSQAVVSLELPPVLTLQLLAGQVPLLVRQEGSGNTLVVFAVGDVQPQGSGVLAISVAAPPLGTDAALPFVLSGSITWPDPR